MQQKIDINNKWEFHSVFSIGLDLTTDHTCFAGGGSSQIMDRMTTMATGNPMLDMDIERKEKASYVFFSGLMPMMCTSACFFCEFKSVIDTCVLAAGGGNAAGVLHEHGAV